MFVTATRCLCICERLACDKRRLLSWTRCKRNANASEWTRRFKSLSRRQKLGLAVVGAFGCTCLPGYQIWSRTWNLDTISSRPDDSSVSVCSSHQLVSVDGIFDSDKSFRDEVKKTSDKVKHWMRSKSTDPDDIIKLTESADPYARMIGLRALATMEWTDDDYRYIVENISLNTLLSLARIKQADKRFFKNMSPLPKLDESLIEEKLRALLTDLQESVQDKAIKQLTARLMDLGKPRNIVQTGELVQGMMTVQYSKSVIDQTDGQWEMALLEALASHSQLSDQCTKIVAADGLRLLQHLYQSNQKPVNLEPVIARILANLSMNTDNHKHIADGGWLGVLRQLLESCNTATFFNAARALANLDRDHSNGCETPATFEDGVYPAHPVYRPLFVLLPRNRLAKDTVDIVFIHGIRGGPFKTWRQEDQVLTEQTQSSHTYFWPKDWLAPDLKNVRILNVGFDTELTTWNLKYPLDEERRTIQSRSAEMIDKLEKAGIGGRSVIWVGHSMGGLLIKEMLRMSETNPCYKKMLDSTIGVLFYSVPHRGSELVRKSKKARYMVFPSTEVQELDPASLELKSLHKWFLGAANKHHIPVLSFGETEKSNLGMKVKALIVNPSSADPGIGKFFTIDSNHINICKPKDKESVLYIQSLLFIEQCIRTHRIHSTLRNVGLDNVITGMDELKEKLENIKKGL